MVENPFVKHPLIELFIHHVIHKKHELVISHFDEFSTQDKAHLFSYAISYANFFMIDFFVEHGFNINYEFLDRNNFYCSTNPDDSHNFLSLIPHISSSPDSLKFCQKMIDLGANVSGARCEAMFRAVENNCMDILQLYLKHGVDVHARNNALMVSAVKSKSLAMVKFVHEKLSVPLMETGADFRFACAYGNLEIVQYLVEQGANIHQEYFPSEYPICAASVFEHLHIVEYLVDCGADPGIFLDFVFKPIFYLSCKCFPSHPEGTCLTWIKNYIDKKPLHDKLKENLLPHEELSHSKI